MDIEIPMNFEWRWRASKQELKISSHEGEQPELFG